MIFVMSLRKRFMDFSLFIKEGLNLQLSYLIYHFFRQLLMGFIRSILLLLSLLKIKSMANPQTAFNLRVSG